MKWVNERVDGLIEVKVCERRMEKCQECDECVKKVDECVKKVDGYETGAGICNERVSVCESHVRDCVWRESMGKLERMLRNEVREEREKRLEWEREVRSLERQVRVLVKKMDERERDRERKRRERARCEANRAEKRKGEQRTDVMCKRFKKLDEEAMK